MSKAYLKDERVTAYNNSSGELFLTAQQKSANNNQLIKEMIDNVDGMLPIDGDRVNKIDEFWNLHNGIWPQMESYLNGQRMVFSDMDSDGEPLNPNSFIVHHPKINNVTEWIMGDIIEQQLRPVVRDFSIHGRKYREEARLNMVREYYQQNIIAPQIEMIRSQYMQEMGITDMMQLNPDEQQQVMADLQRRINEGLPDHILDNMKRIKTPDEEIRATLLNHDITALEIEEKFIRGGEQAVVAYEEYYKVGSLNGKPTLDVLNSKWVSWMASPNVDYVEDGIMAKYEQYLNPHDFVLKYGYELSKTPGLLTDFKDYFREIPGYGGRVGKTHNKDMFLRETELDFVDLVGENPHLLPEDYRTKVGHDQIALLYTMLSRNAQEGMGIREVYTVFKWTEVINYVQRRGPDGGIQEFFFSADYKRDPMRDIMCKKFPLNRVYHGYKVADRFYLGVESVPWQYFGGVDAFDSKLTICGRKYSRRLGNDDDTTLIGPAVRYQLDYNISASKLKELEKRDKGKTTFWNQKMRPHGWSEAEYMEAISIGDNVPYSTDQMGQKDGTQPVFSQDGGITSKMNEYRANMELAETEMYKAMKVNKDALGSPDRYQSNALTQSNIRGSMKQMYSFHNARRLLKEKILNYMNNISLMLLIDDDEKQATILDDFARDYLNLNADDIRASKSSIFIVDDFEEATNTNMIKEYILKSIEHGGDVSDMIRLIRAKDTQEMENISRIMEEKQAKANEQAALSEQERQARELEMRKEWEEFLAMVDMEKRRMDNESRERVAIHRSETMMKAADINRDGVADSIERKEIELASKERIELEKLRLEREKLELEKLELMLKYGKGSE